MAIPATITLTGTVYLKYIDLLQNSKIGDLKLYLSDDATAVNLGDYYSIKFSGYFKVKVFDGMNWQHCNIAEFCQADEYKFAKRQQPIATAQLLQELLAAYKNTVIYRTYRSHFTTVQYIGDPHARKHPKWNRK